MRPSHRIESDIVLLGAGHAHLEVLRRFAMRPEAGVRLTLIGREPETPYSGMLPGLIRGDYTFRQAHVDLAPIAAAAGARLIVAEATAIDLDARCVTIPYRPRIEFELLSIDVGGTPTVPPGAGIAVKPIGRFLDRLHHLEAELFPDARIAVVGGGVAGVELALALAVHFAGRFGLVLVCASPEPIATAPALARRAARQSLVDAGVEVVCGVAATDWQAGRLALSDGSFLDVATAVWATGVEGPEFLAASGLACDPSGCVRVDANLRSISHSYVFAAGDCATVESNKRPKAGVWAVRAGAVLAENLRRAVRRRPLSPWQPQRDALVMLGLGSGKAVAWRNGIAIQGHKVWWLKDRIDRRWVRMYTELPVAVDADAPTRADGDDTDGPGRQAETRTASSGGDDLDPWLTQDDAAVLNAPVGKLLVQSATYLRACVDDPFFFGQIAAAHALSDLYAVGATPWTALAIASVPDGPKRKMRTELEAMLQGAVEVLRGDGCTLVGERCGEAAESALGFAVTGLIDPGKMRRKSGLQAGDRLIMTKKLGTDIILAGHMRGQARAQWLLAAIDSMRTTNAAAARIAMAYRPSAGTHVAGFGLAGHLREMLRASHVAAVLGLDAIPALQGARALAAHGVESTSAADNRHALGGFEAGPDAALLVDPQTSGGLLLGLPASRADVCLEALLKAGVEAAIIGEVEPEYQGGNSIRVE
jgi:selenide, water dikinase